MRIALMRTEVTNVFAQQGWMEMVFTVMISTRLVNYNK